MAERFLLTDTSEAIIRQTIATAKALLADSAPTAGLAQRVMSATFSEADRWEHQLLAVGRRPACREGCPWCCYGTKVEVLAPEALVIADDLVTRGMDLEALGIRATARRVAAMTAEERHRLRVACPLLDQAEGRCSIHPVRPLACRAHGSLRAADCERALADPANDRPIPKHMPLLVAHSAVSAGLRLALSEAGLDARVLELNRALEVALWHRGASERWARGEKLFGQAVSGDGAAPPPGTAMRSKNQRKAARRARRGG